MGAKVCGKLVETSLLLDDKRDKCHEYHPFPLSTSSTDIMLRTSAVILNP
jgi:hypothetical protein